MTQASPIIHRPSENFKDGSPEEKAGPDEKSSANILLTRRMFVKLRIACFLLFVCFVCLTGCQGSSAQTPPVSQPAAPVANHQGKVLTTMASGGYTYIEIEENGQKLWAAAPVFKVAVGDKVEFPQGALMSNFQSKTLNRTFESILFVAYVKVGDAPTATPTAPTMPAGHPDISAAAAAVAAQDKVMPTGHPDISAAAAAVAAQDKVMPAGHPQINTGKAPAIAAGSIPKAGYTVEECFSLKDQLKGKSVAVRGKVVKYNASIMGKNWIHLQDGTGKDGSRDITVTSQDSAQVGQTVLATGNITYDKDFGAGYVYVAIIEDATIKAE
jgi:hypothetical protein